MQHITRHSATTHETTPTRTGDGPDVRDERDDRTGRPEIERRAVRRLGRVWSPAQIIAGIIGLGFLVMGAVALIRIGVSDLTDTATVGWYTHTGILAIIELALGLLFLVTAADALEARSSLISVGVLMVAVGLIAVIEPDGTSEYLGDASTVGWTYFLVGAVSGLVGLTAPVIASARRTTVR